ncbi:MAG TPA: DUF2321 domain-containing protein [Armatimonadota bacterium]|nr:DUF2321 domain-containing protein [Armatimonadota bacterium]
MNGRYDVAQVCPNGHVANALSTIRPQHNQEFCEKCGEGTITECPRCGAPIRGAYWDGWGTDADRFNYRLAHHCRNCGESFPWTERKVKAAVDLAQEAGILQKDDLAELERSVTEVMQDTPQTKAAANRLKRLFGKLGAETARAARDILVDVVSESVKKMIWP